MFTMIHTVRLTVFLIVSFQLIVPFALGQQSQGAQPLQLARLEFEGLKRYGREQIVEASGLKIGQKVTEALLDEAANRIVQTGFFTNVSYRLRAGGEQATVTFKVEEKVEKGLRVVFDNFVWFSDEELANVIRRDIPSYDGTALDAGNITDSIKLILQRLLEEKKIHGLVEYMPASDPSGAEAAHVYTVKGVDIPVCEVAFTGASAIKDGELKENSKPILNEGYSRGIVVGFANIKLGDLYRQRGFLRAHFSDAAVKTRDDAGCKNGVAVTLLVEEGLQYSWDKADWIDNKVLSSQELDEALGMKSGELASITKINKGLLQVNNAFGKKGYIAATLRPMREFDDANKRVTFRFKVVEGVQYKMGVLAFAGLPDETAAHLRSQWKLATGAVYDASYLDDFMRTVVARDTSLANARAGKRGGIDSSVKPDRQSSIVNVTITFK